MVWMNEDGWVEGSVTEYNIRTCFQNLQFLMVIQSCTFFYGGVTTDIEKNSRSLGFTLYTPYHLHQIKSREIVCLVKVANGFRCAQILLKVRVVDFCGRTSCFLFHWSLGESGSAGKIRKCTSTRHMLVVCNFTFKRMN